MMSAARASTASAAAISAACFWAAGAWARISLAARAWAPIWSINAWIFASEPSIGLSP